MLDRKETIRRLCALVHSVGKQLEVECNDCFCDLAEDHPSICVNEQAIAHLEGLVK